MEDAISLQALTINVCSLSGDLTGSLSDGYERLVDLLDSFLLPALTRFVASFVLYLDANLDTDLAQIQSAINGAYGSKAAKRIASAELHFHLHGVVVVDQSQVASLPNILQGAADQSDFDLSITFEKLNRSAPKEIKTSFFDLGKRLIYSSKFALENTVGSSKKNARTPPNQKHKHFIRNQKLDPIINALLLTLPRRWSSTDLSSSSHILANSDLRAIDRLIAIADILPVSDQALAIRKALEDSRPFAECALQIVDHLQERRMRMRSIPIEQRPKIMLGNTAKLYRRYKREAPMQLSHLHRLLPEFFYLLLDLRATDKLPANIADRLKYTVDLGLESYRLRASNNIAKLKKLSCIYPSWIPHIDRYNRLGPIEQWIQLASTTLLN